LRGDNRRGHNSEIMAGTYAAKAQVGRFQVPPHKTSRKTQEKDKKIPRTGLENGGETFGKIEKFLGH